MEERERKTRRQKEGWAWEKGVYEGFFKYLLPHVDLALIFLTSFTNYRLPKREGKSMDGQECNKREGREKKGKGERAGGKRTSRKAKTRTFYNVDLLYFRPYHKYKYDKERREEHRGKRVTREERGEKQWDRVKHTARIIRRKIACITFQSGNFVRACV
jgi:hypothetical protein